MEEIFFDPRGTTISFLYFMVPWLGLFILWLINLRRYEFDPNWGFSRKTRRIGGLITSALYISFIWYLMWDTFFIIRIPPDRNHVVLVYLVPKREVIVDRENIKLIEAAHVWDHAHYTGGNLKSLIIRTQDGRIYYGDETSPEWAEKQAKRLKELLGMPLTDGKNNV